MVINPTSPATMPAIALVAPRSAPSDARILRSERAPLKIATGANRPNGNASRPRTSALVAARSLSVLPELSTAKKDVEDGADTPEEADDDRQHLRHAAHLFAIDDVDHAENETDGVEEDPQQPLDAQLAHCADSSSTKAWSRLATRSHPPAGASVPS